MVSTLARLLAVLTALGRIGPRARAAVPVGWCRTKAGTDQLLPLGPRSSAPVPQRSRAACAPADGKPEAVPLLFSQAKPERSALMPMPGFQHLGDLANIRRHIILPPPAGRAPPDVPQEMLLPNRWLASMRKAAPPPRGLLLLGSPRRDLPRLLSSVRSIRWPAPPLARPRHDGEKTRSFFPAQRPPASAPHLRRDPERGQCRAKRGLHKNAATLPRDPSPTERLEQRRGAAAPPPTARLPLIRHRRLSLRNGASPGSGFAPCGPCDEPPAGSPAPTNQPVKPALRALQLFAPQWQRLAWPHHPS